jgi:hypothetical protein
MNISVIEINKHIEEFKKTKKGPNLLVIGYMTYSKLMKDAKFHEHVTKDIKDPMIRYYRGIEIKMVTKKHHFEIQ